MSAKRLLLIEWTDFPPMAVRNLSVREAEEIAEIYKEKVNVRHVSTHIDIEECVL